jgi:hypothetical protein
MNLRDELEWLIRARYPVLSIISNKETRTWGAVAEIAGERRKKYSNGQGGTPASTGAPHHQHSVQGPSSRKNCMAFVGKIVK